MIGIGVRSDNAGVQFETVGEYLHGFLLIFPVKSVRPDFRDQVPLVDFPFRLQVLRVGDQPAAGVGGLEIGDVIRHHKTVILFRQRKVRAEYDPCIHRALPDGFHHGALAAEFNDFKIFVRIDPGLLQRSAEDHIAGGELAEADSCPLEVRKISELPGILRFDDDRLTADHHAAEDGEVDSSGDEKQRRRRAEGSDIKFFRPDRCAPFRSGIELKQIGINSFFGEKAFFPGDEVQSVRRFRQIADPDLVCGERPRSRESQNCGKSDLGNVVHVETP